MVLPSPAAATKAAPLPLHAGDHLSGSEFLRRYGAMRDEVKAELINGIVPTE